MRGSRLGLCAIVVALAVPAVPASASSTQPDADTLQVAPSTVPASTGTALTLTVTAPANPVDESLRLTVSLPPGWTAVPLAPSDVACPNSVCELLSATSTQIVIDARLPSAHTITLDVQATPPGSAGSSNFTALEQFYSNPPAALEVTAPVTVICPQDGLGTMTVTPVTVPEATGKTLMFTYTAGSCSPGAGGAVGVTVPGGWTPPTVQSGTPGFATWAGRPQVVVSGSMITVPAGNLAPGTAISFEYESAQASSAGPATFPAWQSGAGGPLQPLASSPAVTVTAPVAGSAPASTPPPQSSAPPRSSAPPQSSAPPPPPAGTVAPPAGPARSWLPILLAAIGFVLLSGAGGLLASRRGRRGGHGTAGGSVRAVPRTGPPPSVAVHYTGNRPALTVRIEPRAGATTTTIEGIRP